MQGNFAVDEALFTHNLKGDKIWILGIINTSSKEFSFEAVKTKNGDIL